MSRIVKQNCLMPLVLPEQLEINGNAILGSSNRAHMSAHSARRSDFPGESNSKPFPGIILLRAQCVKFCRKCLTIRAPGSGRSPAAWPWHLVIINARSINFAPCFTPSTTNLLDHRRTASEFTRFIARP